MRKILISAVIASALLLSPLADVEAKSKKKSVYRPNSVQTWTYTKKSKTWRVTNKKSLSTLELIEKLNRKADKNR
jgi:hypothetical protein